MIRRLSPVALAVGITFILTTIFQPMQYIEGSAQHASCQWYPETKRMVCGAFLTYWQGHGGLPQFGYPITNEFVEKSQLNGKEYVVQYFERAVFEAHPENKPPNDVLLSQLGTFQYKMNYPNGDPEAEFPAYPNAQNAKFERDGNIVTTTFQTRDSAQIVQQYYKTRLAELGWLFIEERAGTLRFGYAPQAPHGTRSGGFTVFVTASGTASITNVEVQFVTEIPPDFPPPTPRP
jgi:hypothetical protein